MFTEIKLVLSALVLCGLVLGPAAEAALEDPTYAELRAARPDGRRIGSEDLVLERDVLRKPKRIEINAHHDVLARD